MRIGPLPTPQLRELPSAGAGGLQSLDLAKSKSATGLSSSTGASGATGAAKPFNSILSSAVNEVDSKMQTASTETTKLLTGESTNVHQAVIAMQEAGVAFSLMVEVRNKLVESYQELMRMQV